MVREIAITLYLTTFHVFFVLFKIFPQKRKATFVTSFGDNVLYTLNEFEKQASDQLVILKTSQCKVDFEQKDCRTILDFETNYIIDWIRSIYHLATSRIVFVDNYFGFLAVTKFKSNVKCIQLWHAAGAIKQFGLKDPSIKNRSKRAHRRFQSVYSRFDHVVVGSEKMSTIFQESFGLPDSHMLRTGIPRTDFYYNADEMKRVTDHLRQEYPQIRQKKVIMYAPTYRDNALYSTNLAVDIDALQQAFSEDYILLLRLHPAIQKNFKNENTDFVIDVTDYPDIHHLLVVTDLLITDYSSIPFEFSLLNRPMIFFAYDLETYESTRGFWEDYEAFVPGPVVRNTNEIISVIRQNEFNLESVRNFANVWNEYSTGNSSKRLIDFVHEHRRQTSQ